MGSGSERRGGGGGRGGKKASLFFVSFEKVAVAVVGVAAPPRTDRLSLSFRSPPSPRKRGNYFFGLFLSPDSGGRSQLGRCFPRPLSRPGSSAAARCPFWRSGGTAYWRRRPLGRRRPEGGRGRARRAWSSTVPRRRSAAASCTRRAVSGGRPPRAPPPRTSRLLLPPPPPPPPPRPGAGAWWGSCRAPSRASRPSRGRSCQSGRRRPAAPAFLLRSRSRKSRRACGRPAVGRRKKNEKERGELAFSLGTPPKGNEKPKKKRKTYCFPTLCTSRSLFWLMALAPSAKRPFGDSALNLSPASVARWAAAVRATWWPSTILTFLTSGYGKERKRFREKTTSTVFSY